ncbi:hypothetical protein TARUN_5175 [Trichoderma arundinaceum]|uniref:Uncharacterized protein n=1 Tax=Trichoderma arundinaceum TaxID=490622 RepID=A0A395NMA1_TRIAR|nr:hypothetical protein TARUN_5175 [Trichoderma arundinaceum]
MKVLASVILSSTLALASKGLNPRTTRDKTQPVNFDGPYVTNPSPGPDNVSLDWWWAHVIGDEVDGIVPSLEVILYEGFIFTRSPTDPSFQVDVSGKPPSSCMKIKFSSAFIGTLPNGTQFFVTIPASTTIITEDTKQVKGVWNGPSGEGVASFLSSTGPPRTFDVSFDYPPLGISGSLSLVGTNTPPHTACTGGTAGSRYFDPAIPAGVALNAAQTEFFNSFGWAIAMPGTTSAKATIAFDGGSVSFEGTGYHDQNWGYKPLNEYVNTWLFGIGSCGPYHVAFVEAQPLNSTQNDDFMSGYLAFDTQILQSQCTTYSNLPYPKPNTFAFNISGSTVSPVTGRTLPTNMFSEFVITNGSRYQFDLKLLPATPDLPIYNRWRAVGKGGLVGGKQYDCAILGDWLNPGAVTYTDGSNIFEL